jgi:CRP-like cAMP-binding protein
VTQAGVSGLAAQAAATAASRDAHRVGADWVPVLEEVPLFQGLPRRHLRRIAALGRLKRFVPESLIARAGTPGDAFFVILDGSVRVVPANGRPTTLKRGDFFGEMALLDGAPRSADVTAAEETLTIVIGRAAFAKLLRREPQIPLALLRTVAARLRAAQQRD